MPNYTIVIVTYNRLVLCKECVQAAIGQTISPFHIVIVNNASTDGTTQYLDEVSQNNDCIHVLHQKENIGGAGGFHEGMKYASALDTDWILVIDDDAILERNYVEKLFEVKSKLTDCQVMAGTVKVNGVIDSYHRKKLRKAGLRMKNMSEKNYSEEYFLCDIASFCGLMISREMIEKIGLPYKEYFICHDDTEYCMRLRKEMPCVVVSDAMLNHKTKCNEIQKPRRYGWKDFYEIRNQLWCTRQHGSFLDLAICYIDLFFNRVFRNCFFGLLHKGGYDWKCEKRITHQAMIAGRRPLQNVTTETDLVQLLK